MGRQNKTHHKFSAQLGLNQNLFVNVRLGFIRRYFPFLMYPNSCSWRWLDDDYDRAIGSAATFTVRSLAPGKFDPTTEEMIFKLENEVSTDSTVPSIDEFTIGTKRRTG